jgi:hypothetical protein
MIKVLFQHLLGIPEEYHENPIRITSFLAKFELSTSRMSQMLYCYAILLNMLFIQL